MEGPRQLVASAHRHDRRSRRGAPTDGVSLRVRVSLVLGDRVGRFRGEGGVAGPDTRAAAAATSKELPARPPTRPPTPPRKRSPRLPTAAGPAQGSARLLSLLVVLLGFTFFTPTMFAGAEIGAAFAFDGGEAKDEVKRITADPGGWDTKPEHPGDVPYQPLRE
jgi:hypothetical protein